MSRIASAFGTFILPMAMTAFGTSAVLITMVVIIALSCVTSMAWAPETRNQSLQ